MSAETDREKSICRESFHVSIGPSTSTALGSVVNESVVCLESCNESEYKTRQKRTSRESFHVPIALFNFLRTGIYC